MGSQTEKLVSKVVDTHSNDCIHVSKEQWNHIMSSIECSDKTQSLLFIDSINVKPFYVPSFEFSYDFQYNLFSDIPRAETSAKQFDHWFQNNLGNQTKFVRIHVCNPLEIVRKIVIKCENLVKISFHFFILNTDCIELMTEHNKKLEAINLENSIGIDLNGCQLLTKFQNLKYLNLMGSDIYENSLKVLLENCKSLESLNICDNPGISGECLVLINASIKRINIRDCWRIESQQIIAMVRLGLKQLVEFLANSGICDQSLPEICTNCPNIIHLNISFDDFTFNDAYGRKVLSDLGFSSVGKLENLQILTLRHVGKLTDDSLQTILKGCRKLTHLTINVRHRHKLTDSAITCMNQFCPNLVYFESVHNHFIGQLSIITISQLNNLVELILRGNDFVDDSVVKIIEDCKSLLFINLDGCDVTEEVLKACIERAKRLSQLDLIFNASLIHTKISRSVVSQTNLPHNLRLRVSGPNNYEHFSEFDGINVTQGILRDKFYPFFWKDFN